MERDISPLSRFMAQAVIASVALVAVYGVCRGAWLVAPGLLVLYLGVIFGVGLRGAANWLASRTPLGVGPALALVVALVFGASVGAGIALASSLQAQVEEAQEKLPALQQRLDAWVARAQVRVDAATDAVAVTDAVADTDTPADADDPADADSTVATGPEAPPSSAAVVKELSHSKNLFGWISGFVGGVGQVGGAMMVIAIVGVYLAASPKSYERGLLVLVPPERRSRVRHVLSELAALLRAWIVAQLVAMVVVGVATAIALTAIGMPMPLLLGLLAGVMDFVPNFGPLVAAVPAVLVAAGEGKVGAVVAIYTVIQLAEGWLLRPLIEKEAVGTPPALLIATQLLIGTLLGFVGLLLAPALLVTFTLLIQRFYVEDLLGDDADDSPA